MFYEPGRAFSPLPPGWPAILAIGVRAGVPWLVNPVLSGVCILLLYALVRRLDTPRTARLATVLLATSPWFLFLGMSLMTHTATLACALAAALGIAVARARARRSLLRRPGSASESSGSFARSRDSPWPSCSASGRSRPRTHAFACSPARRSPRSPSRCRRCRSRTTRH